MLPYDYARCRPEFPDSFCENCKRWAEHKDQVWSPRTPCVTTGYSMDESCQYIPIKQEDK